MDRPAELDAALAELADAAAGAVNRWWIIGSAAAALHGAPDVAVADIDLLMSRRDAARLLRSRGLVPAPGSGGPLFRSETFGRFRAGGYDVEVMAGLHVRTGAGWRLVRLRGRAGMTVGGRILYVPPRAELIALLRRFGRDKDLARAAALEGLG
jgi:hypothetical protein